MAVFKTTCFNHSHIPPQRHFIRKIATSSVHGDASWVLSQTTAIDDFDCALLLAFSIEVKPNGCGTSVPV
jgi:hypothetical protein